MIFKVADSIKGSLIIPSLNKVVYKGQHILVPDDKIKCSDIASLIERKQLIVSELQGDAIPVVDTKPVEKEEKFAIITNNTTKVLILNGLVLRGGSTISAELSQIDPPELQKLIDEKVVNCIINNQKVGLTPKISIKTDDVNNPDDIFEQPEIETELEVEEEVEEEKEEKEEQEDTTDAISSVPQKESPRAKVWNMQTQSTEEAKLVPTIKDIQKAGDDPDDDKSDKKIVVAKLASKKTTKKTTKKTAIKTDKTANIKSTNKKTGKKTKKIQPVGEEIKEKLDIDFDVLPEKKPSDTLQEIIESYTAQHE